MSIIVPAILTNSLNDFGQKLKIVENFPKVTSIHIDFADNQFVPNNTVLPSQVPSLPLKYLFEAHLMVKNPEKYLSDLQRAGFETAVFHIESFLRTDDIKKFLAQLLDFGLAARLAINPDTPIERLRPFLQTVESVQIMGVEPGFYGGEYIDQSERIRFLRSLDFYGTIVIDGGVDKNKVLPLLAAGADALVVGSAIFKSRDPKNAYLELLAEAGTGV